MANTTPPRAVDLTLMIVPPLPSTSISATVILQSRHVLVGSPVYAWAPGLRTIQPLAAARGFRNRRATTETCSPMVAEVPIAARSAPAADDARASGAQDPGACFPPGEAGAPGRSRSRDGALFRVGGPRWRTSLGRGGCGRRR